MRPIAIVVEGQSEKAFVDAVLQPHLGYQTPLTAIVVQTSRPASGGKRAGGGRWKNYRSQILRLVHQPHWSLVTTMIDFYGLPSDMPDPFCDLPHRQRDCVRAQARAIEQDIGATRFLPYLVLHEFEALVIAAGSTQDSVLGSAALTDHFRGCLREYGGDAELIDGDVRTAPSKRIKQATGTYNKVRDGLAILQSSGLDAVLPQCAGFARWVERLRTAT